MAMHNGERFLVIRDILLSSFNKHGLSYKLFGGVALNLHNDRRETTDIDMAIQRTMESVYRFVDALVDCEYGTRDEVLDSIFGADPRTEEFLFAFSRVTSNNPYFAGFHIDLCFDFGATSYETIVTEKQEINGITVEMATLPQLLKMKKAIDPKRDRDLADIEFIESALGLSGEDNND